MLEKYYRYSVPVPSLLVDEVPDSLVTSSASAPEKAKWETKLTWSRPASSNLVALESYGASCNLELGRRVIVDLSKMWQNRSNC